jgi:hypothetical protein
MPNEASNNVQYIKEQNKEYNVQILKNNDINEYKNEFSKLIELFHLATISALKSDIIRFIFLYKKGGIWIDMNTTLVTPDGIQLFNKYNQFDFVITILPNDRNDLKTSVLISKPNSKLAYDTIVKMTENLNAHYKIEKNNIQYISYNYFMFIAPVIFYDKFRKNINLKELKKFDEYNCGLMCVDGIFKFYGCNMTHHGENFHKHWSIIQNTQKLFRMT